MCIVDTEVREKYAPQSRRQTVHLYIHWYLRAGTVSVVAPIVGTESLFGVAFSALLLHQTERVGARLVLGAVLVVAGAILIGVFR